jgi:hypothetical protein
MGAEAPAVNVKVCSNGVFLEFPIAYMVSRFGARMPELITLVCGDRKVVGRLYTVRRNAVEYRIYSRYVPAVLHSDECILSY